jgi:hypothetical protein
MTRAALLLITATALCAQPGPFDGKTFHGRIAWSADGNHNDEDDWAASPVALAIFAAFGAQDKVVHFDYNSILNNNDPAWEKTHEESVLGAVERFGYDRSRFHSDQRALEAAIASLVLAINASSAQDPLYLVIAGPMEVAYRAIQQAEPAKRAFVYSISHSNWNDGFSPNYRYNFSKHDVIATGVKWIQIRDQNQFLSTSPYGRPAQEAEWRPFHWLRDSSDGNLSFLWQRLQTSTRADCSDAGMAYFLMTGDEDSEMDKVRALLERKARPKPLDPRPVVRLEAENAHTRRNLEIDFNRAYRDVSHRMNVKLGAGNKGTLGIRLEQPYTTPRGRYDVQVRYFDGSGGASRMAFFVNGKAQGAPWTAAEDTDAWRSRMIPNVEIATGDELTLEIERGGGEQGRVDYVELHLLR